MDLFSGHPDDQELKVMDVCKPFKAGSAPCLNIF
jgi:hypothetical protein